MYPMLISDRNLKNGDFCKMKARLLGELLIEKNVSNYVSALQRILIKDPKYITLKFKVFVFMVFNLHSRYLV